MNTMCFVPFAWGTELEIFEYERHLINALQAPMQDRVKKGSYRVARPRLWPRFRSKPSLSKELELNQCEFLHNLGKTSDAHWMQISYPEFLATLSVVKDH